MSRRRYVPLPPPVAGWIVIRDMTRAIIDVIDCSAGGVQEAYERKCRELEAEGWVLGDRFSNERFATRGKERWQVGIERDPNAPPEPTTSSFLNRR